MSDERRRQRREMRLVRNESSWLQKALFALSKAEDAHEKLADFRDEDASEYVFPLGDGDTSIHEIEDALQARLDELQSTIRESRQRLR